MSTIRSFMTIVSESTINPDRDESLLETELNEFFFNREEKWPEGSVGASTASMSQGKYQDQKRSNSRIDNHPLFAQLADVANQLDDDDSGVYDKDLHDREYALADQISQDLGIKATSIIQYASPHFVNDRHFGR